MSNLDYYERRSHSRRKYRKQHNLEQLKALWGKADGTIGDVNHPGRVWIQVYSDVGTLDNRTAQAPDKLLSVQPGTPVRLKYDWKGRLQVDCVDNDAVVASGVEPLAQQTRSLTGSTPQAYLETLRLVPKSGLFVSLRGWNPKLNGTFYEVSFADIDLTSKVPAAGNMCYAVIGVKGDLSGTEVYASTARAVSDMPLDIADVNETLSNFSANATQCWAVKLIGGQTSVTQADIDNDSKDLRQVVNTSAGRLLSRVTTQFDKTNDASLATVTGLSVNALAGRTYSFRAILHVTADATGGHQYAIGGTATATAIIYQINALDNGSNAFVVNSRQTALAGAAGQAGAATVFTEIVGLITVNAGGTLVVQFAQNAATPATTSSVLVGSTFVVEEVA